MRPLRFLLALNLMFTHYSITLVVNQDLFWIISGRPQEFWADPMGYLLIGPTTPGDWIKSKVIAELTPEVRGSMPTWTSLAFQFKSETGQT